MMMSLLILSCCDPPFLVNEFDGGVNFLLAGRVRIDAMKHLPAKTQGGGPGGSGK